MSEHAIRYAFESRGLIPAQKLVLICLAERHAPGEGCHMCLEDIAEFCEISEAAAAMHLQALEAMALIRSGPSPFSEGLMVRRSYVFGYEVVG